MNDDAITTLRELADAIERERPLMEELVEAARAVSNQLDYLQNLWTKEGITDGLAKRLRDVLAKIDAL